jgi:5'-3' exonuclease
MNIDTPQTFLFIDGSYFCYHRYFSLMTWWKNTFPETPLENPFENTLFVNKFKHLFIDKLKQIPKILSIHNDNPLIIVGKDCKRTNIWRNQLFPAYKATRYNTGKHFMGGPFFTPLHI